jgi:hypothetical protein
MDSRASITREQAEKLRRLVQRDLHTLNALCRRMELRGFPADDKLYAAAMNARHAVQGLFVDGAPIHVPDGERTRVEKSVSLRRSSSSIIDLLG